MAGLDLGHDTYTRRMRWRLDVEVVIVAQCTLTSREHGLWEGYNDRIREELECRHGPGVLAQVRRKATTQWRVELALMVAVPVMALIAAVWWVRKRLRAAAAVTR